MKDIGADPSSGMPDNIATGIEALVGSADRLGLKWRITPATAGANAYSGAGGYIGVTLDGDTSISTSVSLVGPIRPNARVMVLDVPPTNKYVIGYVTTPDALATTTYASNVNPGTTTSATFVLPTTASVGVSFIGPRSGIVEIYWSAEHSHSVVNGWAIMSPNVRAGDIVGSGAVFYAANDNVVTRCRNATALSGDKTISNFYVLTGLTPGQTYNVELYARTASAGTATYEYQTVMVKPVA